MRLRRKPWINEAIKEFEGMVILNVTSDLKGKWQEVFGGENRPLFVELGTGKGNFITELARLNPEINYIGIEAQQDVLYFAAKKAREKGLTNVRFLVFDINNILDIFTVNEVDRFYLNFSDPWPKSRHAKRRLTHHRFLNMYRELLKDEGEVHFKTDNEKLFEFSLNEMGSLRMMLKNITFDLHNSSFEGNVMTEYEKKFSSKGQRIFRVEGQF